MRITQVKRNGSGLPVVVNKFEGLGDDLQKMVRAGVAAKPKAGGKGFTRAKTRSARLNLIRNVLARMKREGKIIPDLDDVLSREAI